MRVISLYPYINTVVAVLLGTMLLAEVITLRILMAIATILAGSAIVTTGRRAAEVESTGRRR
jgi:drug/metabolite transporter (DMT)-like permease